MPDQTGEQPILGKGGIFGLDSLEGSSANSMENMGESYENLSMHERLLRASFT